MQEVSKDIWEKAQIAERGFHVFTMEDAIIHFNKVYKTYFDYFGLTFDINNRTIIEIGPADIPALSFCKGNFNGIIIEPMPSKILESIIQLKKELVLITDLAETIDYPKCDEIWLFNVLQHVINPDIIIEKAKDSAKIIRFFEPIHQPIDDKHLHEFSIEYFEKHFGNIVKKYQWQDGIKDFHTQDCAYGTWTR